MIDSYFRNSYQRFLVDPLLNAPLFQRVLPSLITLTGGVFGILCLLLLYFGYNLLAFVSLLISGYFDTLDGTVARLQKRTTPQGAALDIFVDRLVEFSVLFGLYCVAPDERAVMTIFMLGGVLLCITSFLIVGIFSENSTNKGFHYSPGIMERAEAFVFFALMILLPELFFPLSVLFSCLVTLTAVIRLVEFNIKKRA